MALKFITAHREIKHKSKQTCSSYNRLGTQQLVMLVCGGRLKLVKSGPSATFIIPHSTIK